MKKIILIFFCLFYLSIANQSVVFAEPQCGWECRGSAAVCKPGGDEWVDYGYGCPCHIWCEGNGSKTSDVAPCIGAFVQCFGQWNRKSSGCCNPPSRPPKTPTLKPTSTPTPSPSLTLTPTPTPTLITTPTLTPTPTPTLRPTPTLTPTPTPTLTSTFLPGWFQTQNGDVHSNGNIYSEIPENNFFSLGGEEGDPGVVSCFNNDPYFSLGRVSEKEWLATGFKNKKTYDYSYFDTLLEIPQQNTISNGIFSSTLEGNKINNHSINDFHLWKIEGDLEVKNLNDNLGTKIFLVSGKVIFKNDLNLQNTLPVFISQGDMEINPAVHILNGVLISDGTINTGEVKEEQTLIINGAAISWRNFSLKRERETNNQPAEFFAYNPEIPLSLAPFLGKGSHIWEELAP